MAHSGYCCAVDMWHTLSTIISLLTCTFQHYRLVVAKILPSCKKQIATLCVVFDLVYSWTVVENVVAKGGVVY